MYLCTVDCMYTYYIILQFHKIRVKDPNGWETAANRYESLVSSSMSIHQASTMWVCADINIPIVIKLLSTCFCFLCINVHVGIGCLCWCSSMMTWPMRQQWQTTFTFVPNPIALHLQTGHRTLHKLPQNAAFGNMDPYNPVSGPSLVS